MVKQKTYRRQSLFRLFTLLAIVVMLNMLASVFFTRIDLTADQRFTLSDSTKSLLRKLPDVVYVKVFLAGDMPAGFQRLKNSTRDILDEMKAYAGDKLQYDFTDPFAGKTEDEKNQIEFFEAQLIRVRKRMQEMEMAQVNAFENTAEAKARNRTIVWWAANLAAEENNGIIELLLGNGQIEDRLDVYDSIIENDKFIADCFSRINYLVTVWYLGSASSFEDFKSLDDEYLKRVQEDESILKLDSDSIEDKSRGEKESETITEINFI